MEPGRRQRTLEAQWLQVKAEMTLKYSRAGLTLGPLDTPDVLPDLAVPGTFVVKGRVAQGEYEEEIEIECESQGGGSFSFPILAPTTLSPRAMQERQREESSRRLDDERRRQEEELRLSPEERAEQARRVDENERIAEAERVVRERRRRDKLAWAERVLDGSEPVPREAISSEVRRMVFERDNGRCVECGSNFEVQYDHIIPIALGGANSVENLQVLCATCNQRKGASI
jgi:5-methylcytosine-specific restriction endonuclease McrA